MRHASAPYNFAGEKMNIRMRMAAGMAMLFLAPAGLAAGPAEPDVSLLPAPDAQGQWGYVDAATGKTLIAPRFSAADFFYDGVAVVSRAYPEEAYEAKTTDGRTVRVVPKGEGVIGRDGREILPARYSVKRANTDMGQPY
jgi:hypothetical protein